LSRTASHSLSALAAGAILLSAVALTAAAQNVLPPDADNSELIFEETPQSIPQAPVPATASAPASVAAPVQASATKDSAAKEVWDDKPLRDPFWPVGYFPEGWQKAPVDGDSATLDSLGWKAAAAKIRVSGTSLMNGKTAAVVDGSLKVEGDVIEVKHDGRIYQWLVASIDDQGQIHLKKQGIK
jgi:hypothetical protein